MMATTISISTNKAKINLDFVHDYLSNSAYWSKGRSKDDVRTSIENSLCFSLFFNESNQQIGFARVATDYVVFAWIMDVFIKDEYQGKGLGKLLIQEILNHPKLKNVNGFGLRTFDAQGFYGQFGFESIPEPQTWMFKKNKK
ncbi:MAG: GNAT family N-acetyltransferase [Bacteroidota bacterium]